MAISFDIHSAGSSDIRAARLNRSIQQRLSRLPFHQHPAFRWSCSVEGYAGYVFGARAGPEVGIEHLCHELAHAVEFGSANFKKRNSRGSFVFSTRMARLAGLRYPDPLTAQATLREARVFGIQKKLLRATGVSVSDSVFDAEALSALGFMHDWYYVDGDTDAARGATIRKVIAQGYAKWSLDAIYAELDQWLNLTEKRLKRAPALAQPRH